MSVFAGERGRVGEEGWGGLEKRDERLGGRGEGREPQIVFSVQ